MDLDELVIRIQVAADGVEDTLTRVAEGIRAVAAESSTAAGRWAALSVQARDYANACAAVEAALLRVQAAMAQADGEFAQAFEKAQASVLAASAQLDGLAAQLVNLPEGQLRLDSAPAMQAISGVVSAWSNACAAMSLQSSVLRTSQVVQNVNFNVPVESPNDTRQKMEEVNLALGRLLK